MQKLGATQVEHELREQTELPRELEGRRVVFLVLGESRDQLDQQAVEPADDVYGFFHLRFVDTLPRNYDGRRFLIETIGHLSQIILRGH